MTRKKLYRYLGRNGILTTRVLIDGVKYVQMYELIAGPGKILTNGEEQVYSVIVDETASKQWKEIADKKD